MYSSHTRGMRTSLEFTFQPWRQPLLAFQPQLAYFAIRPAQPCNHKEKELNKTNCYRNLTQSFQNLGENSNAISLNSIGSINAFSIYNCFQQTCRNTANGTNYQNFSLSNRATSVTSSRPCFMAHSPKWREITSFTAPQKVPLRVICQLVEKKLGNHYNTPKREKQSKHP